MSEKKEKKSDNETVLLVGGGTGGHVVPVYNIYRFLINTKPEIPVAVIGSGSKIEKPFFGGLPNYFVLTSGKFQGYDILVNLWQSILFCAGFVQALVYLNRIRPKIIFAKGGYVTVPIIIWARILHIPYFVHESDIVMGRANRFAATGARKVFVGFPVKNYPGLKKKKIEFCGQLITGADKFDKKERFDFGFPNENPVIFVTGGSLGAVNINKSVFGTLTLLLLKYNIIHQTGAKGFAEAINVRAALPESMKRSYFIADFLSAIDGDNKILSAIELADLIIARAGATTVAEIARSGKPMILIPYPHAAGDHQVKNAQILEQSGVCMMIYDRDLTPRLLIEKVDKLFDDKEKMREMARVAKNFFPSGAIDKIGKEIISEVSK